MYLFLYVILSFPLLISFYYSYENNMLWVLSSIIFLLMISSSLLSLSTLFKKKWVAFCFTLLPLLIVFLAELTQLTSFYLQGEGFNNRFFFHFTLNTIQETWGTYPFLSVAIGIMLLSLILLIYINTKNRTFQSIPVYLSITILLLTPLTDSALKDLISHAFFKQTQSMNHTGYDGTKLETLKLNKKAILPNKLEASSGKNLVLIYLESLESIYMEEAIFPELTPTINHLVEHGLNFTNISQTPSTGWTIAGIVASQCGTPLITDNNIIDDNDIMQNGFLSEATCLGDILNQAGYVQEYIGGASLRFAGKGNFFKTHQYDKVTGYDELKSRLNKQDYKTGWGLYDDTLFNIAYKEYVRLANKNQPFNLTLLTLDTHHPNGHSSHSCKPYKHYNSSILDAVHCTDYLLDKFLKKISQHPAFKETIVVLLSDHLAMRNNAQQYYPKEYDRKLFFTMINTGTQAFQTNSGTHMDIAPTILDAIGIQHNAHFLAGRNLLAIKADDLHQADFFSNATQQAIKYINSHFFTKMDASLCKGKYLLKGNKNTLIIGNKEIALSFGGFPINEQRFKTDFVFIAFIDDNGSIKNSSLFPLKMLHNIISANINETFILLAPNKILPFELNNRSKPSDGMITVLFGRFDSTIINLGTFEELADVQIERQNCENLRKKVQTLPKKATPNITGRCPSNSKYIALYTKNDKLITIPILIYHDQTFKLTLTQNTQGQFTIKNLLVAQADINDWNYCYASFAAGSLSIPAIRIDGTVHSLEMPAISITPFILEINEKDSALFGY